MLHKAIFPSLHLCIVSADPTELGTRTPGSIRSAPFNTNFDLGVQTAVSHDQNASDMHVYSLEALLLES